jgi:GNAT superfamily N-acetyltransferase
MDGDTQRCSQRVVKELRKQVEELARKNAGLRSAVAAKTIATAEHTIFTPLTEEYITAATECIASQFTAGEPMTGTRGIGPSDFEGFAGIHCRRSAELGKERSASTVCTINGEVAAVCISEDMASPLVPEEDVFYANGVDGSGKFKIDMDKWLPLLLLLGGLDEKALAGKDLQKGELFHQFMVAVNPKFQKRGLCKRILEANLKLAKERGYRKALIECTGNFSHGAAVKLGYKLEQTSVYKDFQMPEEYGGGRPFAKTGEKTGHEACFLSVLDLCDLREHSDEC